MIQESVTS